MSEIQTPDVPEYNLNNYIQMYVVCSMCTLYLMCGLSEIGILMVHFRIDVT